MTHKGVALVAIFAQWFLYLYHSYNLYYRIHDLFLSHCETSTLGSESRGCGKVPATMTGVLPPTPMSRERNTTIFEK
jgi:hypothetical protein